MPRDRFLETHQLLICALPCRTGHREFLFPYRPCSGCRHTAARLVQHGRIIKLGLHNVPEFDLPRKRAGRTGV